MTEKITRRGVVVPHEYVADILERTRVGDVATSAPVTLASHQRVGDVRAWLASGAPGASHQGYPVVAGALLQGLVTRRAILDPEVKDETELASLVAGPSIVVRRDQSLRVVVDTMLAADTGSLPVVDDAGTLVAVVTRRDVLSAHRRRVDDERVHPTRFNWLRRTASRP